MATNVTATIEPRVSLRTLGVDVSIRCPEPGARALLTAHYGPMRRSLDTADLTYTVARPEARWRFTRDGQGPSTAADPGELLLALDQDLIIQLQKRRPDLYFVHAAVLESAGTAFMLVAPSGGGKSTTAWGLVHHGFPYLSDELAPVDLHSLTVHPYPRALALKSQPPGAYPLPGTAVCTSRGFLVTAAAIPSGLRATAAPLAAIFFLRHDPAAPGPSVRSISAAEAGARLYANALNALAHPAEGIDGAVRIALATRGFVLCTADLAATCALVDATLARRPPGAPGERR